MSKNHPDKYDSLKHPKYVIKYHIIFSTKYRKKLLSSVRDDILRYMKCAETKDFEILLQEVDKDHIHLLIKATPNIAPYEIAHRLKQQSTYLIWKEHNSYMKQWYWSNKHHLWTRGYFCSTIGDACADTIMNYIKNQG